MATKYGFNITIGANTDPFTTALNKLNKPIKDAQSSIKRLNEGLNLNPRNTEILRSKFEQLGYTIGDLRSKLDDLKEARANLEKEANGKYTEEQYRTLQKLNGEIAVTEEELKQAQKEYNNFGSIGLQQVHAVGEAMQDLGEKITNVGKTLMPVSILAGTILTGAVKSASDWETAWVGVTKTVDGTDEQMSTLEQDLLNMSKNLGVSKSELAGFAEALGQSGVQVDNIAEMTRVISDLNVATNITGEEGARQLAQLFNIMKLNNNEVSNFGSALTALGNEFPTTEKDILDLATNMASTGDIVGLTGQELLALSTALTSLGAETEAGGTAMTKMFKNMQRAVAGGGDQLEKFANVSQMSVEDFSELFKTDALGALRAFTKGLSDMQDNGGDVILTLDDMKLSEVRLSNQLLKLVSNTGVLDKALETSRDSWNGYGQEIWALAEEADKRYGTLTYRVQALKEQIDIIGISLGDTLLPIIKDIINRVQEWLIYFESLDPQLQEIIVKALLFTTALAPILIGLGKVIYFGGIILAHLPSLATLIGALTNPVTIVIGVIGGLILILKHLYDTNEEFRENVTQIWENIVTFFENFVMPTIDSIATLIKNVINTIWTILQDVWNLISPFLKDIFDKIVGLGKNLDLEIFAVLTSMIKVLADVVNWIWVNVIQKILYFVLNVLKPGIRWCIRINYRNNHRCF